MLYNSCGGCKLIECVAELQQTLTPGWPHRSQLCADRSIHQSYKQAQSLLLDRLMQVCVTRLAVLKDSGERLMQADGPIKATSARVARIDCPLGMRLQLDAFMQAQAPIPWGSLGVALQASSSVCANATPKANE